MNRSNREIKIVGGGLAGLALGIALRRRDTPVALYEAGNYPRHKVCGEYIAGLSPSIIESLGIGDLLADANPQSSLTWFCNGKAFRSDRLRYPALGISRYRLDERMADRFAALGGRMELGQRIQAPVSGENTEGWVWAYGRRKTKSDWIGLKVNCRSLSLANGLEMHLGNQAYAGACALESGRVNVCGLFRARKTPRENGRIPLLEYLKTCGFEAFAKRVEAGDPDIRSHCGVSAISFGVAPAPANSIHIGDSYATIPPFTGAGMTMSFEGAIAALSPIIEYSKGHCSWENACRNTRRRQSEIFRARLAFARILHPFLYGKGGQSVFRAFSASKLLPFSFLLGILHKCRSA